MKLFMAGLRLISPFLLSQIQMVWCHTLLLFLRLGQALQMECPAIFYSPEQMLLQRNHISPFQKDSPRGSEGSLTAAPLQTASACRGCTGGQLGAFPGTRPVPCMAFQLLASAPGPCPPKSKHSTQLQVCLQLQSISQKKPSHWQRQENRANGIQRQGCWRSSALSRWHSFLSSRTHSPLNSVWEILVKNQAFKSSLPQRQEGCSHLTQLCFWFLF